MKTMIAISTAMLPLRLMVQVVLAQVILAPLVMAQESSSSEFDSTSFEGIWSGVMTTPTHEYWNVEDHTCFAGCPKEAYELLTSLLDDPANDERPLSELEAETTQFMREHLAERSTAAGLEIQQANTSGNDPTIFCRSYGYVRQSVNPLPMEIRRVGDTLIFDYEEWNLERIVYLDDRDHPQNLSPTQLGHSIGRFEGSTLIVETTGVAPAIYYSFQSGGGHSDQLSGVERYTLSGDPAVLTVELTVQDPVTLTEPFVLTKSWVSTPNLEMLVDSCEDIPGVP